MPHKNALHAPVLIETQEALKETAPRLRQAGEIGVDIESNSFYAYSEKVCLIQFSTRQQDFIVDPLSVKDLSALAPIFHDPGVEKVFHAGEYDILCLKRDYGFKIVSIFDTMVAAQALGLDALGLAPIVERRFGVRLSKKLQRADWAKRPLTPEHGEYARLDTHFLLPLRDMLKRELEQRGLLREALDEFHRQTLVEPVSKTFDPQSFWRLPGARNLQAQAKAVLQALHCYREKKAAALDRAPFRILPEELLVRLAGEQPRSMDCLRRVKGMSPYLAARFGGDILAEIEKGLRSPPVEKPPERRETELWDGPTRRRYEALRGWRRLQAERRGVNPAVIMPNEHLRALAQGPRASKDPALWLTALSPYKRETYGEELSRLLAEIPPAGKAFFRRGRRSGSRNA